MKIDDSTFFRKSGYVCQVVFVLFFGKKWVKICLTICILKSFFLFLKVEVTRQVGFPGQLWRNAKQF